MRTVKRRNKKSEHLLLTEGAKSYPQALAALSEFRKLVLHAFREAFEEDLVNLSSALGVRISRQDLLDRRWPDSPDGADAVNAELGIRLDRRREGWRLYYCLAWRKSSTPELWLQLVVRFTGRERPAAFYDALDKARRKTLYKLDVEGSRVYVSYLMKPDPMSELPLILHGLNQESIRVWRAVGGLKKAGLKTRAASAKGKQ